MAQVVCLGELLIDFVALESGVSLIEAQSFKKAAGGAPANVAVGLARLGKDSAFLGKVGDESFGEFLIGTLRENGVDVSGMAIDKDARTMLAFVSLTSEGERDFMFYRHPSADMRLTPEDIPTDLIANAKLFHYGSISLISDPCRSATLHAIDIAKKSGLVVSYDPNLRLGLWESEEVARQELLKGMKYADVVKINEIELEFLTGTQDFETGGKQLLEYGPSLLFITLGGEGCYFYSASAQGMVAGRKVQAVDTTGCGDGFTAGLLSRILDHLPEQGAFVVPEKAVLEESVRFANAVGAITAMNRGAIPSLPTLQQVQDFLQQS